MDTTARRVGKISAISAVLLSAAYIITGSTWFISHFDLVKTSGLLCLTGVVFLVTGNTQSTSRNPGLRVRVPLCVSIVSDSVFPL